MTWLAENPWIAVAAPVAVALMVAVLGRALGRAAGWVALLAPLVPLGVGLSALGAGRSAPPQSFAWLGADVLPLTLALDPLAILMLLVVGVVASCVVVFSVGYMAEDESQPRYFAVIALFVAAMSLLLLAGDLIVLLAGWELVGTCSYLLIGFWYGKPSASDAALKAFLTTHVGDAGMLLGIALLWSATGSVAFAADVSRVPAGLVTAIALLLLLGAVGKSAQFPLHFWLPDAMEGPTPVSALIHAATMVAAGVFLVVRLRPLFDASPVASSVVLGVGVFTALMAATIAVPQTDIKKVLAYSTISQLGFMFAALGAGAWGAAMFHLVTHAAFKALLFLGAGSVIHGSGTQDLRDMGGLARRMPATAVTWIVGGLALAGVPPLAGFFSKDAVVVEVLHASPAAGIILLAASALTAFYVARATRLAFFGPARSEAHAHESSLVMLAPLAVLAAGALLLGLAGNQIASLLGAEHEALDLTVAAIATTLALGGLAAGWLAYAIGPVRDESLAGRMGWPWNAARSGYGFDALVRRGIVLPVLAVSRTAYDGVDRSTIDGTAEGIGRSAQAFGRVFALLQTGDAQWYGALMGAGVVVMLAFAFWAGR